MWGGNYISRHPRQHLNTTTPVYYVGGKLHQPPSPPTSKHHNPSVPCGGNYIKKHLVYYVGGNYISRHPRQHLNTTTPVYYVGGKLHQPPSPPTSKHHNPSVPCGGKLHQPPSPPTSKHHNPSVLCGGETTSAAIPANI
ncbi:hypothetical protein RRG08_026768 [Elysia crispata]|uniref:Uncharacterized protein n=1 Tax=Elysia crispata TaxID=231223 RepID=A0AAE1E379_9GAST|nr:hypothetical protein RRG08_026768 [Elysia crispata]